MVLEMGSLRDGLYHEGGTFTNGISALVKATSESSLSVPGIDTGKRWLSVN